eukprot:TRINITY_DN51721_c0_g1_i1.p1 TRINITY_DN51721_c0_g1~~TRINITY_DN51721_c0_g1_i1.p1  ORF type:complete len:219 (-),score=48.82 TRINITY_DN51721_c0_g1_i1:69-725(-)
MTLGAVMQVSGGDVVHDDARFGFGAALFPNILQRSANIARYQSAFASTEEHHSAQGKEYVASTRIHDITAAGGARGGPTHAGGLATNKGPENMDMELDMERLSNKVQKEIDTIEARLDDANQQKIVLPLPASGITGGNSSIKVTIGKRSTTRPDIDEQEDRVNRLLERVEDAEMAMFKPSAASAAAACPPPVLAALLDITIPARRKRRGLDAAAFLLI